MFAPLCREFSTAVQLEKEETRKIPGGVNDQREFFVSIVRLQKGIQSRLLTFVLECGLGRVL